MLVVGVTSAVGAVSHARAGRVQWRTGLIFGVAGMAGAYAGGLLARFIPGTVLLIGFAVIMIATAIAMLRGRKNIVASDDAHRMPVVKIVAEGLVVGLVTGLVGAGGGFLVVPALALLGGLPMPVAVGTSLIVIAMKSFAGLAGYLSSVHIDWAVAGAVTAAARRRRPDRRASDGDGQSRCAAQVVRLVRPGDVVGHSRPGDPPQRWASPRRY